jgi:hypothetical protein
MGKIRSAIELAMERTNHMSLSREEKEEQKKINFEKMLHGALQQYSDGLFSINCLQERIKEIQSELKISGNQLIIKSVLDQIYPDEDNEHWLNLLAVLEPSFRDSLEKILSDYDTEQSKLSTTAMNKILEQLSQKGISGSAILANPEKDESYQKSVSEMKSQAQTMIDDIQG